MGIVITIPNVNFTGKGVPLNSILPIDNIPVLILDAQNYNGTTGVWQDVITGKTSSVPSGAVAPSKVAFKGNEMPFFQTTPISAIKVELDSPNVNRFTINYVMYNLPSSASTRYVFDLIKDSVRFVATSSYGTSMSTGGGKVFSTDSGWQDIPTTMPEANARVIISITVDRTSGVMKYYENKVLKATVEGFIVKPLNGDLHIGRSNLNATPMVGYLGNFSIYEGIFDQSKVDFYYNSMGEIYGE